MAIVCLTQPYDPPALLHLMKSALAIPALPLGLSLTATAALPLIDDFNDGNDDGWTQADAIGDVRWSRPHH